MIPFYDEAEFEFAQSRSKLCDGMAPEKVSTVRT